MGVGFRETLIFCHQAELVSSVLWSNNFKIFLDSFVRCFLLNTLFPIKAFTLINLLSHQSCYMKKVFLKILQNSQENTCAGVSFLIKLQASGIWTPWTTASFVVNKCGWWEMNIMKYYYFVNEFEQIKQLLFFMKSSENYRFSRPSSLDRTGAMKLQQSFRVVM